jgi:hypothetical protein
MHREELSLLSLLLQVWGLLAVVALTLLWRCRPWALAIGPVLCSSSTSSPRSCSSATVRAPARGPSSCPFMAWPPPG